MTNNPPLLPMDSAPKDKTPLLMKLKDDLSPYNRMADDWHTRWQGRWIVAAHPGIADDGFDIGWSFAAPVGHGGFSDAWFDGWMHLPSRSTPAQKETEE